MLLFYHRLVTFSTDDLNKFTLVSEEDIPMKFLKVATVSDVLTYPVTY